GSFVPKTFSLQRRFGSLTDLGFIVVQIDGMGTANRSKAFHDVCWKNLKDAGFPDRILWHQAAAKKYAYYDATRVGIYGTSAGSTARGGCRTSSCATCKASRRPTATPRAARGSDRPELASSGFRGNAPAASALSRPHFSEVASEPRTQRSGVSGLTNPTNPTR